MRGVHLLGFQRAVGGAVLEAVSGEFLAAEATSPGTMLGRMTAWSSLSGSFTRMTSPSYIGRSGRASTSWASEISLIVWHSYTPNAANRRRRIMSAS